MKIFVPGRVCLFGEHTDWAGGYRRINSELEKGYTLITGTNQGIYANIKAHPNSLVFHATMEDGRKEGPFKIPMKEDSLLKEAEKGGFFSYVCGVAYQVLIYYRVRGIEIENYRTDLPVKKGLSSSAAVCVLTARAFNRIYDLKMTTRGEMEYAYLGEVSTPSRCGRMDQGCAYGNRPILMIYDGDRIDVRELNVPNALHLVIVDLKAKKDTKEILKRLNQCYPFADNDIQKNVQKYLGAGSMKITLDAIKAIEEGDAGKLGKLMVKAQQQFDKHLIPACPSQLKSPVLHKVLDYEPIQPYIYGGKGVGSQGDGTAQFIAKDRKSQAKVKNIIESKLKLPCLEMVIHSMKKVRKVVIPAAGFGTRLFPATKAVQKELFPVIDQDGRIKPAILIIIEEALSAGIEEICVLVQKEARVQIENFFNTHPVVEHFNKLSKEDHEYLDYILEVGSKITFIEQDIQEGFGHAVYCAKEWVGNEPFLLLLGDHLYTSSSGKSCASQVVDAYERVGKSIVGLKATKAGEVSNFGCVSGVWEEEGSLLEITEFAEKPSMKYAREHLKTEGIKDDNFLTIFGQYVLKPEIFNYLEYNINNSIREKGEFQLTSCLDRMRREDGFSGYIIKGGRFDIGLPEGYRRTIMKFRKPK